ncbi:two-component system, chemotaxis family, response regulator CheB [Dyella sp. OK004]|uniref:chemotaxis protein CheB n=1 Tax=Dyella sp. OK004 TaxID=1855292 RepID=UPI0008DF07DB|nr:chemotaxis protein CheB [Dyella sp. OK004]SFS06427.1 two-component system, chemotaxis family, response regulator CheB [Dyella sp. OK004]
MAETAPAVALLFDDAELGAHLREALRERGARIVHEGTLATLSRDTLLSAGAQVVVVNLDDDAADALDHLYDVIDGDHPRVVFNDAQVSRKLDGWDRARWARHLAVKVLAEGDIDPPRPLDAPAFEPPVHEPVPVHEYAPVGAHPVRETPTEQDPAAPDRPQGGLLQESHPEEPHAALAAIEPEPTAEVLLSPVHGDAAEASETLAAELEALLAADESVPAEDDFGSGLNYTIGEHQELHDGHFGADTLMTQGPAPLPPPPQATVDSASRPAFQLDHVALTPVDDDFLPLDTPITVEKVPAAQALHTGWSLVDDDAAPATKASAAPKDFGVEKVSAADYLAPEGGSEAESNIHPGMTLELVSIEEAIAPQNMDYSHEMQLGELDTALGRLLLLGATMDSTDSVCAFLAALPASLRMTVLHTQHQGGISAEDLAERLSKHSVLPVRVASHGMRARHGEVLIVPASRHVRLLRDGRVECEAVEISSFQNPSIDASFTTAASVFGRDAIAIVFAGHATDAVAGAQAVHDRGGKVWVEQTMGDHYGDMVHGVEAERLAGFSGTPFELAARLVEEFSVEAQR